MCISRVEKKKNEPILPTANLIGRGTINENIPIEFAHILHRDSVYIFGAIEFINSAGIEPRDGWIDGQTDRQTLGVP